jgi:hypothetical protein
MRMVGRARDVYTPTAGAFPSLMSQNCIEITATAAREIIAIQSIPHGAADLQGFVGARGGGHSRTLLAESFADKLEIGSPLYLLLDDYAGASLVAGWAWSQWSEDWSKPTPTAASGAGRKGSMEGICAGFRPGSSALTPDGTARKSNQSATQVPQLQHPDDPEGWHDLPAQEGVGMRRARRLDVWHADAEIHVDSAFQDSASLPGGGRIAVHEYLVSASICAREFKLKRLHVDPRILPYRECPAAAPNAQSLVGLPVSEFRQLVLRKLPGTLGCTHLNDVLRSLADVPWLSDAARAASQQRAGSSETVTAQGKGI